MERWRQPLNIVASEPGDDVELGPDGVVRRSVRMTFDRASTERIRLGYACAKCLEVFEFSWPVNCPTCGAPVRERQLEYFAREYAGEVDLSPTNWKDERASLDERRRKEEESNGNP